MSTGIFMHHTGALLDVSVRGVVWICGNAARHAAGHIAKPGPALLRLCILPPENRAIDLHVDVHRKIGMETASFRWRRKFLSPILAS